MTNAKNTKRALLMSILSMMLCVAMLIGSTFAWFTDSVTSGKNKIVAGNLDVELYHANGNVTDEKVEETTNLFTDKNGNAILWEPGVMVYENFTVKNVGSLALKYLLTVNAGNFNTIDGKSLKDVLKVAILDGAFTGERAAAQELTFDETIADFEKSGNIAAGAADDTYAIVIYWEPTAADNDYNLNNGKASSDGKPLFIDLGVNLVATQDTVEEDSFGKDYDANAEYPVYNVSTADELIAALKTGGFVTLTDNIAVADQLVIDEKTSVQLDLAGKTLNSSFGGWTVVNNGTLTIDDSTGNGTICNTSTEAGDSTHFILRNHGTMIVNGGTFGDTDTDRTNANTSNWGAAVMNVEGSTTINGGYFTCGDNYWSGKPAGANYSYAIRNYGGTMTINDGTVYGKMNGGIAADNGEIIINGGDFSLDGGYYVLVTGKGTITVNDGVFTKTGNDRLLGGFSGMPSWDATEDLAGNGYTVNGGTFIVEGQTVTLN